MTKPKDTTEVAAPTEAPADRAVEVEDTRTETTEQKSAEELAGDRNRQLAREYPDGAPQAVVAEYDKEIIQAQADQAHQETVDYDRALAADRSTTDTER